MKLFNKIALIIILVTFCAPLYAQYNGYNFSISGSYTYTTTSKLYLNPKASDEFLRGIHSYLDKIPGFGIEFRAKISDNFFVGLGADFVKKKEKITSITVNDMGVTVEDGYQIIPVEITAYYVFPFSLKNFKFFMGGGGGFYFGSHIRTIGDISAQTEKRETSFGIHVLVGLDAMLTDYLSIRGTLKFRDMEVSMYNKYNKTIGELDGMPIQILNNNFDSKAVVDGLIFNIGLSFYF